MSDGVPTSERSRLPALSRFLGALERGDPGSVVLSPLVPLDGDPLEPEVQNPRRPAKQSAQTRGHPVAQIRGVLADQVVVSTPMDPFLPLKALAAYSGLGVRKLREYLADPAHPLPYYRVGGKILVRRSEFDAWVARYRRVGNPDVEQIVSDALRALVPPVKFPLDTRSRR